MKNSNLNKIIAAISNFEEYENFKLKTYILERLAQEILDKHKLAKKEIRLFADGTNIVFAYSDELVIKIFPLQEGSCTPFLMFVSNVQ